jgi:hypothetical protein
MVVVIVEMRPIPPKRYLETKFIKVIPFRFLKTHDLKHCTQNLGKG